MALTQAVEEALVGIAVLCRGNYPGVTAPPRRCYLLPLVLIRWLWARAALRFRRWPRPAIEAMTHLSEALRLLAAAAVRPARQEFPTPLAALAVAVAALLPLRTTSLPALVLLDKASTVGLVLLAVALGLVVAVARGLRGQTLAPIPILTV